MTLTWLTDQFSPQAPLFWLTVGLLTTALLLSLQDYIPRRWRSRLWFAHWLLIPYLGLLAGGLSPRLLGLANIDWLASLGLGLGLLFGVVALLVFVRAVVDLGDTATAPSPRRFFSGMTRPGWQTFGGVALWSGIEQFHWAFLRGGLHETFLALPEPPALPGYWAIWGAAGVILIELLWSRPNLASFVIQLVTLLTTSILFFYTHNYWLCWTLHLGIHWIAAPPAPKGRPLPVSPTRVALARRR
jgi:hypothetical protein